MIGLSDINSAVERIRPFVVRTLIGTDIYLKTGSFKTRGAFNQILQLDRNEEKRGVVGVSGGNFAQAVAYAGAQLGIETVICMPEYTPPNYIKATKSYGATVDLCPDFPSKFENS